MRTLTNRHLLYYTVIGGPTRTVLKGQIEEVKDAVLCPPHSPFKTEVLIHPAAGLTGEAFSSGRHPKTEEEADSGTKPRDPQRKQ